jgi:hypothetical protein
MGALNLPKKNMKIILQTLLFLAVSFFFFNISGLEGSHLLEQGSGAPGARLASR